MNSRVQGGITGQILANSLSNQINSPQFSSRSNNQAYHRQPSLEEIPNEGPSTTERRQEQNAEEVASQHDQPSESRRQPQNESINQDHNVSFPQNQSDLQDYNPERENQQDRQRLDQQGNSQQNAAQPQSQQQQPQEPEDNTQLNQEIRAINLATELRNTEKFVDGFIWKVKKWNAMLFVAFLLMLISFKSDLSFVYTLGSLVLFGVLHLVFYLLKKNEKGKRDKWKIFQVLIIIGILVTFGLYLQDQSRFKMIAPLAPVVAYYVLEIFIQYCADRKEFCKLFNFLSIAFRIFLLIQALTICLKMDELIEWRWREIFWAYWVLFSIMIGFSFASTLMLLSKICALMISEVEAYEMKGVVWLFLLITGSTAMSCAFIIDLLEVLDDDANIKNLYTIITIIIVYNCVSFLFTIMFKKDLKKFFVKLVVSESDDENDEENPQQRPNTPAQKKEKKKQEEPEPLDIPKFLTKFSGTYFRRATDTEIKKVKDAKKKKKTIVPSQKANPLRHYRNHSVDQTRINQNKSSNKSNITAQMTTQLGLLTIQETDREVTANNISALGAQTTDRNRSMLVSNRGMGSIVPNGFINEKIEEQKTQPQILITDDTVKDERLTQQTLPFAPYSPKRDLDTDDRDYYPPESTDADLIRRSKRLQAINKIAALNKSNKEKSHALNASNGNIQPPGQTDNSVGQEIDNSFGVNLPVRNHRRVHSMQVTTPGPMFIAVETPKQSQANDEESKCENSFRNVPVAGVLKSPTASMTMEQKCLVCFDQDPDAVFMECGHGGVCYDCSLEVWKSTGECYLCRDKIKQVLQVDLKAKLEGNVMKVISATQMIVYEDEDDENLEAANPHVGANNNNNNNEQSREEDN